MSQHRPEYLRTISETTAKPAPKRRMVERLAALPETIINHNPDLPVGIAIIGGILVMGFTGLLTK